MLARYKFCRYCDFYGFQSHCTTILCGPVSTFPIVWCVVYIHFAAYSLTSDNQPAEHNTGVVQADLPLKMRERKACMVKCIT